MYYIERYYSENSYLIVCYKICYSKIILYNNIMYSKWLILSISRRKNNIGYVFNNSLNFIIIRMFNGFENTSNDAYNFSIFRRNIVGLNALQVPSRAFISIYSPNMWDLSRKRI